ncbi:MAG TPA: Crp/Fnr family transcriptional regulator [Alphaproteobacteria bacterium]|nr:Crp/Fnr family transcriptional regulator [Alphaproteobacteria bacterium]
MPQSRPQPPPSVSDRRIIFRRHPLFAHLADADVDQLLRYARIERHKAGRTIFLKGSPGHGMMAVLSGQVRISAPSPEGKEIVLNLIGPGEVFGEIALLDGHDRTADASAMIDCELLVLERRDFIPFLERHPEVCIRLMEVLCARLRRTSEQVEDVLFLELPARLAKTLLRLAKEHGHTTPAGQVIDLKLSQRELGNLTGATRESVNKQLKEWERDGILRLENGAIVVTSASRLEALAER